jgi:hypothetical protein
MAKGMVHMNHGSKTDTVDTLQRTKDWLLQNSWCQFTYLDGDRACLVGALEAVTFRAYPLRSPAAEQEYADAVLALRPRAVTWLAQELELTEEESGDMSIEQWNDQPNRTFEDVMDLLDAVILAEKEVVAA